MMRGLLEGRRGWGGRGRGGRVGLREVGVYRFAGRRVRLVIWFTHVYLRY